MGFTIKNKSTSIHLISTWTKIFLKSVKFILCEWYDDGSVMLGWRGRGSDEFFSSISETDI